jgi:hypothetical protein
VERGIKFAGASCVIDLKTRTVLGHLDGQSEAVLVVDTERSAGFRVIRRF